MGGGGTTASLSQYIHSALRRIFSRDFLITLTEAGTGWRGGGGGGGGVQLLHSLASSFEHLDRFFLEAFR